MLFGGVDSTGPTMFHTDPSGTMVGYHAKGLGSAEQGIQSLLDKYYKQGISVQEGERLALAILKQVMEEKIRGELVDVFSITSIDGPFVKRTVAELDEALKTVEDLH